MVTPKRANLLKHLVVTYQTGKASPYQLQQLSKLLLYEINDYAQAGKVLRTASRVFPNSAAVFIDLAIAKIKMNDLQSAERHLRKAVTLKRTAHALCLLADVVYQQGRSGEAKRLYRRAIRLDPQYEEAYYNLGVLLKFARQYSRAESVFRQAIKLDSKYAEAYAELGYCLLKRGQIDSAKKMLNKSIALDDTNCWPHVYLANLLWRVGNLKEAEREYRFVVSNSPANDYFRQLLDEFLQSDGSTLHT